MGVVERRFDFSRQRDTFDLHEAAAADTHPTPVDANGDAIANLVLRTVRRRQSQAQFPALLTDRARDRVMKPLLGCGRKAKDLQRVETIGADHPADLRSLARQCPGLVEKDGVDLAEKVERSSILNEDAPLRAERQCRQHRQRCRHPDAGAKVAIDHRHRALRA